jgi:hypothetical protein
VLNVLNVLKGHQGWVGRLLLLLLLLPLPVVVRGVRFSLQRFSLLPSFWA